MDDGEWRMANGGWFRIKRFLRALRSIRLFWELRRDKGEWKAGRAERGALILFVISKSDEQTIDSGDCMRPHTLTHYSLRQSKALILFQK